MVKLKMQDDSIRIGETLNNLYIETKNIVEKRIGKLIVGTDKMIDLEMDSISFVALIVEIEDHFNIDFPTDKLSMEKIRNFDEFVSLIEKECL